MTNVTWLVGIIEDTAEQPIILKIVPNRRIATIFQLFNDYILPGTTVILDGYPLNPASVRSIQGGHIVVNHSDGFTNFDGILQIK